MVENAGPAEEIHGDSLKKKNAFSACDVSQRSFPCPGGDKVSARPRSALARGGSPDARRKRVYSSCGSRRVYYDATSLSSTQLLLENWKELLKRSSSVFPK